MTIVEGEEGDGHFCSCLNAVVVLSLLLLAVGSLLVYFAVWVVMNRGVLTVGRF